MYNIIEKKKIWFIFSGILMAASIVVLSIWGLRLGIDFTGGSLLEISYSQNRPDLTTMESSLAEFELESLKVQPAGEHEYILRFEEIDEDTHQNILNKLQTEDNQLTENRFEAIGPSIGDELKTKAIQSIVIVLLFIVIYISF